MRLRVQTEPRAHPAISVRVSGALDFLRSSSVNLWWGPIWQSTALELRERVAEVVAVARPRPRGGGGR